MLWNGYDPHCVDHDPHGVDHDPHSIDHNQQQKDDVVLGDNYPFAMAILLTTIVINLP